MITYSMLEAAERDAQLFSVRGPITVIEWFCESLKLDQFDVVHKGAYLSVLAAGLAHAQTVKE